MFCSFHCTSLSSVFLILKVFFDAILSGIVFAISFLIFHSLSIEMQLIFVCELCILLFCWIHLLVLKTFCVKSLGSHAYKICKCFAIEILANRDNFTSLLPVWISFFLFSPDGSGYYDVPVLNRSLKTGILAYSWS